MKLILIQFFVMALALNINKTVDVSTVHEFNVWRYLGLWYEIARFDSSFERGLERVTANYSMMSDGTVRVVNQGYRRGKIESAVGRAKLVDRDGEKGVLKVSFFWVFYAPYRVLMLAEDYSWAVVSSGENALWILSRTERMDGRLLDSLVTQTRGRGFDTDKLIFVKH